MTRTRTIERRRTGRGGDMIYSPTSRRAIDLGSNDMAVVVN